jgi:hypothetical protein
MNIQFFYCFYNYSPDFLTVRALLFADIVTVLLAIEGFIKFCANETKR